MCNHHAFLKARWGFLVAKKLVSRPSASNLVKCFGRDETTLVAAEYSDFGTARSVRYVANVFHLLCAQIALSCRHLTCVDRFGHRSVPMVSNQWCNDDMTSFERGDFFWICTLCQHRQPQSRSLAFKPWHKLRRHGKRPHNARKFREQAASFKVLGSCRAAPAPRDDGLRHSPEARAISFLALLTTRYFFAALRLGGSSGAGSPWLSAWSMPMWACIIGHRSLPPPINSEACSRGDRMPSGGSIGSSNSRCQPLSAIRLS